MALFKKPPRIEVLAPKTVVAGAPFRARVMLHCEKPVPVDWVGVHLHGQAVYQLPYQDGHGASEERERTFGVFGRRIELIGEHVELAAQRHEFDVDLMIPAGVPGTYFGPRLMVRWTLKTQVSIPWWPDPWCTFPLHVMSLASNTAAPAPPTFFATHRRGPAGRLPYAELSLASTVVRAGDVLRGYVSLANTAHNRYFGIDVSLQQFVTIDRMHRYTHSEPIASIRLPPSTADNTPIPFALEIPLAAVPAFTLHGMNLAWRLRCDLLVQHSPRWSLHAPITITNQTTALPDPSQAPSLAAIGSERRDRTWLRAAEQTGFTYENGALVRRQRTSTLTIALESSATHGNRLIADARVAEIDIGLHLDDDGQLRGRDPEHTQLIAEATGSLTANHRLAGADDRHLRYAVSDGGTRHEALVALARWIETLTAALLTVRRQLPAPASVAHVQPAFERAAAMLGATFVPAGMDVWGRRNEVPFSLEVRWDGPGEYRGIVLTVSPLLPIDGRYHGHFTGEAWPDVLPEGLSDLLEDVTTLVVQPRRIELHLGLVPDRDTTEVTPEPLVERLEALIAIGLRMSMRDGVYR